MKTVNGSPMLLLQQTARTFKAFLLKKKDRFLALTLFRLVGGDQPRCLVNTIPKAGTHLIERCLALMPGIHPAGYHLRLDSGRDVCNCVRFLRSIGSGCFVTAHLPFSAERLALLKELGYRHVLLVRDPRDVAVSLAFFLGRPTHALSIKANDPKRKMFRALPSFDARLATAIVGAPSVGLPGIDERYRTYLPWVEHGSLLVKFEDLVGEKGGGSLQRQIETIKKLAAHLGATIPEDQALSIANRCYSRNAGTFRKGVIGDWRNHFKEEHKRLLKESAGRWLIELGYEKSWDW